MQNKRNCVNVGLTQSKALIEPTSIHKLAIILAAKFREKRGKNCIFREDNGKMIVQKNICPKKLKFD